MRSSDKIELKQTSILPVDESKDKSSEVKNDLVQKYEPPKLITDDLEVKEERKSFEKLESAMSKNKQEFRKQQEFESYKMIFSDLPNIALHFWDNIVFLY